MIKIIPKPYKLAFKYPFRISYSSREITEVLYLELHYQGFTGYGEAAFPPYLKENKESALKFLHQLELSHFNLDDPKPLLEYLQQFSPEQAVLRAGLEMAILDVWGKIHQKPAYRYFDLEHQQMPLSSYTFGLGDPDTLAQKKEESQDFHLIKIKLSGTDDDVNHVAGILKLTGKPFMVDLNQGWKNRKYALEMSKWLIDQGVVLIEQPFEVANFSDTSWLAERLEVPVIADEAIQNSNDLSKISNVYTGINVKLMKTGGLTDAYRLISQAKAKDMKILIGCMSESSCGVTAAAHLCSLADWADLDGPYLIRNDAFDGMKIQNGRVRISQIPGLGVRPNNNYPALQNPYG
ncbi:MAG: dipeptide epimerase [Candidatus Cyclobacteriaceae bacterium M3_2C_046]